MSNYGNKVLAVTQRELKGYFNTPLAYIFIAAFLGLAGFMTFQIAMFFEAEQADLAAFFTWHPWLYLFLVPAISMRLWAEERRSGTIELLFTLPISQGQAVLGKFLAGWLLLGVSLALTFPLVITTAILGDPDFGQILAGYIGSFLMAGAYLAIGCCMSAATRNQVVSFVLTVVACFVFMLSNLPVVLDFFSGGPAWLVDAVVSLSFLGHFESITKGVIGMDNIVFFLAMAAAWLYACSIVLETSKDK